MTGLVKVVRQAVHDAPLDRSISDPGLVLLAGSYYGFVGDDPEKIARAVLTALLPHLSPESRKIIEEELGDG